MAERNFLMKIHEAYNLAIEKVRELQEEGFPITSQNKLRTANIKHSAEYEINGELPKELWNYITFSRLSDDQLKRLLEVRNYLAGFCIWFDHGTFLADERPSPDWQLDWSFCILDSKYKLSATELYHGLSDQILSKIE